MSDFAPIPEIPLVTTPVRRLNERMHKLIELEQLGLITPAQTRELNLMCEVGEQDNGEEVK